MTKKLYRFDGVGFNAPYPPEKPCLDLGYWAPILLDPTAIVAAQPLASSGRRWTGHSNWRGYHDIDHAMLIHLRGGGEVCIYSPTVTTGDGSANTLDEVLKDAGIEVVSAADLAFRVSQDRNIANKAAREKSGGPAVPAKE